MITKHTLFLAYSIAFLACSFDSLGATDSVKLQAAAFRSRCMQCHSIACNRSGPKLEGVVGRKAAGLSDYTTYSDALRTSGLTWTGETLNAFLADPGKTVPGTYMPNYRGVDNAKERTLIIQFIERGDTSLDICVVKK